MKPTALYDNACFFEHLADGSIGRFFSLFNSTCNRLPESSSFFVAWKVQQQSMRIRDQPTFNALADAGHRTSFFLRFDGCFKA
jgi:hypothetical protein